MSFCSNCGAETGENAKFCPACGSQVQVVEPVSDDPYIGQILDNKFKIEELLGVGGMGRVYKATQLSLDKIICVKVLRQGMMQDETLVGRFQREARAASRLNHPNSISVIDFGQAAKDGSLYLAMEYVPGRDLGKLISEEWPLEPERIVNIVDQVLSALADAHAAGIVHRDLKPENIMVADLRGTKDFVKVLDFGIAKIQETSPANSRLTQVGMVCGTPEYMSPEQARGESLDARSDVYATGVVLYQMVVGRLPFEAPTAMGIVTKHLIESPVPPSQVEGVEVSHSLEAVILKAMSKDPAGRQPTVLALQQELNQVLTQKVAYAQREPLGNTLFEVKGTKSDDTDVQAQRMTTVARIAGEKPRRAGQWLWLVSVILLILGGVAGYTFWLAPDKPQLTDEQGSNEAETGRSGDSSGQRLQSTPMEEQPTATTTQARVDIPESAKLHYHAGKEFMVQNKLDKAIEELQKAVRKAPRFAAAHKALGTAYMRLGRIQGAKQHFQLYLNSAPDPKDRKDIQELINSL